MNPPLVTPINKYEGMDMQVINLAKAIRQKESGGNFEAVGDNGTSSGAYQWQSGTWKEHARTILGDEKAEMTKSNQNAVAYGIIKQWKDDGLTPAQIASKWNSGRENGWETRQGTTTRGGKELKYDTTSYVKNVTDLYHKFKSVTATPEEVSTVDSLVAGYNRNQAPIKKVNEILGPTTLKLGENIGNAFKSGIDTLKQSYSDISAGVNDPEAKSKLNFTKLGQGLLGATSGLIETIFSPLSGVTKTALETPGIEQAVGLGRKVFVDPVVNDVSNSKMLQNFVMNNPNAERVASQAINVGGVFAGGKNAPAIKGALTEGVETGAKFANSVAHKAQSLVVASEKSIENNIAAKYNQGVKPLIPGKSSPAQVREYTQNVTEAINTINKNKQNLRFEDGDGLTIDGELPKNLQQTVDAIEQTKKKIFEEYDALATQAGEGGLRVELKPIVDELDTIISDKALNITNPKAVRTAQELQQRLRSSGSLDAKTVQDVIQNYNAQLKAFYRNPTADAVSDMAISAMVANKLRVALDEGVTQLTGKQYGALKRQYGSLKAIERDVVKASIRDARKAQKGLIDFTDILSGGDIVRGVASGNIPLVLKGTAQKALATYYKFLNNPNRSIQKMFKLNEKLQLRKKN
jgi:hypothetical protein